MRWTDLTLDEEEQRRLPGQCMAGDTAILMADGRTKPLAEIRVGDAIVGTIREGIYRLLSPTRVLAHWSSVKPAYGITLANGRELIASAEHRLLTPHGWAHVIGTDRGLPQAPHLTLDSELTGTDVSIVRTRPIEGRAVKAGADLKVASIEPLGTAMRLYDITTGTGDFIANGVLSHNCLARSTPKHLDFDASRDFEREISESSALLALRPGDLVRDLLRAELA